MRKLYDIMGDYSGLDTHSGVPENHLEVVDSDFLMLLESYIDLLPILLQTKNPNINSVIHGFIISFNGCLKNISHEEKMQKYTYALQRLCELNNISNVALSYLAGKSEHIRLIFGLTGTFFENENHNEIIAISREVLTIDPSLDHVIKPVITERLYLLFGGKKISLDALCTQIYENQDVVDVTFFTKRIQLSNIIEPSDVIELFEKHKTNPSFLLFLQKLHFLFDKNQIRQDHNKKISAGTTKNHLRISGKSVHIQHNPLIQNENRKRIDNIFKNLDLKKSDSVYGLQYDDGKYSIIEYQGNKYDPIKPSSKSELSILLQDIDTNVVRKQLFKETTDTNPEELNNLMNGFRIPMADEMERRELQRRRDYPSPVPVSNKLLLNETNPIPYSPFDTLTHTIEQVEQGILQDEALITQEVFSGVNNILTAISNRKNGRLILSGELNARYGIKYENIRESTTNSCIRVASKGRYRSLLDILSQLKKGTPSVKKISGIEVIREGIDIIVERFGYEYVQTPYKIIAGRDYHTESESSDPGKEIQSYEYAQKLEAILKLISESRNPPRGKVTIYGSEDLSYAFFYYAEKNVTIFVSNLYGKATFIFRGEISQLDIARSSLLEIAKKRTLLERLNYNPDSKDAWLKRIMDALEPQKDAANVLVKLYKEGILKDEHIGTSQKFNTFVINWNAFISSGGPDGDFPLSDPWTDFVTNELVRTGDYNHLRLISNRVEDSSITIGGIISALGGDKAFTNYKGMTHFLGGYITMLLQNQLYPDGGHGEMAQYLAEEVFQGAGASKNVKDWVDKLLRGELKINPVDLQTWTNPETRSKHGIPVGVQTIPSLGIKLKLPEEKRTPDGIFQYITSVKSQVQGTGLQI